jgi:hypothetical protein
MAEPWHVFLLSDGEPIAYDIVFCNDGARASMKALAEQVNAEWLKRMVHQVAPPYDDAPRIAQENIAKFKDPANAQLITECQARAEREFFWRAGTYKISLVFVVDGETREFFRNWKITISPEMERDLKFNAWRLVAGWCLQPAMIVGQYYTAWPPYEEPV